LSDNVEAHKAREFPL